MRLGEKRIMQLDPVITITAVGILGGMVRSLLGYFEQSDEGETFSLKKLGKSMARAGLIGGFVASGLLPEVLTIKIIVATFFLCAGVDVLAKEGFGTIKSIGK